MKETEKHFKHLLKQYGFDHNYLLKFDPLVQAAAISLITAITDYLDNYEASYDQIPANVPFLLGKSIISEEEPAKETNLDRLLFNDVAKKDPESSVICNYKTYKTFPGYIQREALAVLLYYYNFHYVFPCVYLENDI